MTTQSSATNLAGVDQVAEVVARWGALHPDLDLRGMAVVGRVKRLVRLVEHRQAAILRGHGLQDSDLDVLSPLYRSEVGLRPRELRRLMLVGSGTLTARIDRLEAAGLIERTADPTDRRGRILHLTTAGRELTPRVVEAMLAIENELLAVIAPADRDALAADLGALLAALERAEATPAEDGPDHAAR